MERNLQNRAKLSPDNPGPFIVVTSYVLMSIMILCTIARLRPGRHTFSKFPRLDEFVLLLAMVRESPRQLYNQLPLRTFDDRYRL